MLEGVVSLFPAYHSTRKNQLNHESLRNILMHLLRIFFTLN